jgi:nitrilase
MFRRRLRAIMSARDLPSELEPVQDLRDHADALVLKGGSAIVAPDGGLLASPVFDEETILMADLDFSRISRESLALDVSGHYSRPDIFDLRFTPRQES